MLNISFCDVKYIHNNSTYLNVTFLHNSDGIETILPHRCCILEVGASFKKILSWSHLK